MSEKILQKNIPLVVCELLKMGKKVIVATFGFESMYENAQFECDEVSYVFESDDINDLSFIEVTLTKRGTKRLQIKSDKKDLYLAEETWTSPEGELITIKIKKGVISG